MPPVRSYSEWIQRVNTMTDLELRAQKPLDDLREFVVQQWKTLLFSVRHGKKLVETYKKTVRLHPMEFDPDRIKAMETMVQKRIQRLYKVNLDIPSTTKMENVWGVFSKKFQRLEQEEAFYLETKQRVDHDILQPLSRMQYEMMLYKEMAVQQQLAKQRVKRL